ncbi:MAG: alpha/beta fold hydrolase [Calditrichaeota bacterium]|nr:MAG: alpha/beta fold hydrolase [Calditrichota bacterium]
MDNTAKIMPGAEPIYETGGPIGILMLHGFTGTPYEFRELAERCSGKGYTVDVPLLDGHGTKSADINRCHWHDWYGTAKKHLFDLRKKCHTVFVIGQSMGGTLAVHLAAHYQVEGVVLLAPAYRLKHRLSFLAPIVAPFWHLKRKQGGGPDIQNLKSRKVCVCYPKIPIKGVVQLKNMIAHVADDFQDVHIPVLLAHAVQDHTIRFKGSKELYERLSSRDKTFLELNNSFHVLTLDNDKDIVFREIETFIQKRVPVEPD